MLLDGWQTINRLDAIEQKIDDYAAIEDAIIRASRKAGTTRKVLNDTFDERGLMAIYVLGLRHMYEYLENK